MEVFTIGRAEADIILEDDGRTVSKQHAELTVSDNGLRYYLVDCGSSNGTYILRSGHWERIKQETVNGEDFLRFGSIKVRARDLVKRLPNRTAHQSPYVEPPAVKVAMQPFQNPATGEVEYR